MALPQVETGVIEMIAEEEAQQKRAAALAALNPAKAEVVETKAEETKVEVVETKAEETKVEVVETKAEETKAEVEVGPDLTLAIDPAVLAAARAAAKAELEAEAKATAAARVEAAVKAEAEATAAAIAAAKAELEAEAAVKAEVKAEVATNLPAAVPAASSAIATAAHISGGAKPEEFLASLGISDLKLDFTSFPTVTLNDAMFHTDEHKKFAETFECVYIDKRETFLFRGDYGRDKDPELVYSDNGLVDNKEGKPMAEYIERWKAEGTPWDRKSYIMVLVTMVGGVYDQELVQLQVSPASRGKLDGYLTNLGIKRKNPREVVTKISVGTEVGSGVKAFTPWSFKLVA